MARRDWPLMFKCSHDGCREQATYRYPTRRDMMQSFELKNYSDGRWRCYRHSGPDGVLSATNLRTRVELVSEDKGYGRFFGSFGVISGPGFKAFSEDFPPGTKVIVTAELILPTKEQEHEG